MFFVFYGFLKILVSIALIGFCFFRVFFFTFSSFFSNAIFFIADQEYVEKDEWGWSP